MKPFRKKKTQTYGKQSKTPNSIETEESLPCTQYAATVSVRQTKQKYQEIKTQEQKHITVNNQI